MHPIFDIRLGEWQREDYLGKALPPCCTRAEGKIRRIQTYTLQGRVSLRMAWSDLLFLWKRCTL